MLYLHLHEAVLAGLPGTARVEGLGPHCLTQLRELLAHHQVSITPVLDLAERLSTTAYEHPEALKERIHLLRPGDAFPHATRTTRSLDLDHAVPYDPGGPPGQTTSHTTQPLSRTAHRAKTHLGYTSTPLPTDEIIWHTPHGLHPVVDAAGTYHLDTADADAWQSDDALDRALTRLLHRHHTGQLT